MPIIAGGKIMPGYGPYYMNGVPSAGTNEVQTVTITGTPTGGTFKLSYQGHQTAPIAYNANAAAVQAALEALPSVGAGNVLAGGGALPGTPVTVTFQGNLGKQAVPLMGADDDGLTGGTDPAVAVTETTPGVDASFLGALKGATAVNIATGVQYQNTGTETAPTWTAQS